AVHDYCTFRNRVTRFWPINPYRRTAICSAQRSGSLLMDTPGSEAPVRSPWHAGELAAQARVGVSERMAQVGPRTIRPFMPDQHRLFFASLPFLVVGSVDQEGWPWASLLSGAPGFVTSPDPTTLHVAAWPLPGDPLAGVLAPAAAVGPPRLRIPTPPRHPAPRPLG